MSWAAAACLLQHCHHPRQMLSAVEECVGHLCGLESRPLGLHTSVPSYLRTIPAPDWIQVSTCCAPLGSAQFPSRPPAALHLWSKASADGIPGASVPGIRRRIFLQNCRVSLHEVSRSRSRRAISEASCPPLLRRGDRWKPSQN